jgi:hypothetical protein
VISLGLLWLAAWRVKPSALLEELAGASALTLALSLLGIPVLIGMRALRWHILARTRSSDFSFARSFHSYMGGLALAVITPWSAGELARGALAAPDDRSGFTGLTLLDKMFDLTALLLLACVGFVVVAPQGLRALGLVAAVLVLLGWVAAPYAIGALERRMPDSGLSRKAARALEAARGVGGVTLAGCFAFALANFALLYCHLYMIMYAFAPDVELKAVGLFPLITLLSRVVPSIAGLGVRELTAGALFARADYQVSSAGAGVAVFTQFVALNVLPAALWVTMSGGFTRFFGKGRGEA